MKKGLIHIYTGDGKGKTTAAIGLSVRAVGAGKKVLFAQFMKGINSSELKSLRSLGVTIAKNGTVKKFVPFMSDEEKALTHEQQQGCFHFVEQQATHYDLVILDEMLSAITTEMVAEQDVLNFLANKPEKTEVVLTGRDPSTKLIEVAHYVSNIQSVKHPYDLGITARKGIEF